MATHSTGSAIQTLSSGNTIVSEVLKCNRFTVVGGQVDFTNVTGLTGNITVQVSDDPGTGGPNAINRYNGDGVSNWFTVANPASAAFNTTVGNIIEMPFPFYHTWVRVVCTWTAGTGSVVIRLSGKGDVGKT